MPPSRPTWGGLAMKRCQRACTYLFFLTVTNGLAIIGPDGTRREATRGVACHEGVATFEPSSDDGGIGPAARRRGRLWPPGGTNPEHQPGETRRARFGGRAGAVGWCDGPDRNRRHARGGGRIGGGSPPRVGERRGRAAGPAPVLLGRGGDDAGGRPRR